VPGVLPRPGQSLDLRQLQFSKMTPGSSTS
jgi:hypothetical protein